MNNTNISKNSGSLRTPAPNSQLTVPILSLAPETFQHILELGCEGADGETDYRIIMKRRRQYLAPIALVCRAWRYHGQAALWKVVHATGENVNEILSSTVAGKYTTNTLCIRYCPAWSVQKLLQTLKGLKTLEMTEGITLNYIEICFLEGCVHLLVCFGLAKADVMPSCSLQVSPTSV